MTTPPVRTLGKTGIALTTLAFGGGPIGWRAADDADAEASALLDAAWSRGIRYFDTAPFYGLGQGERRLGRFLATKPRDALVLSSKVGRLLRPRFAGDTSREHVVAFDYSYAGAMRSIEESLQRLGLDRIDVVLIHDIDRYTHGEAQPRRFREAVEGAYRALTDLKEEGAIRAIGLGVNEWQVCRDFWRAVPVDCFLLAGRHTLLEQEAQREFLPEALERGIGIIIGGPYNSGILASGPVPGARYDYLPATEPVLDRVRRIEAVCHRFGVLLAAAALAFPLLHAAVTAIIPGTATRGEFETTLANFRAEVPPALWQALADEHLVALPEAHRAHS